MALPAARALLLLCTCSFVAAHDHHDISEEDLNKPLDSLLWLHISLQFLTWGIIFPTGMILGLVRQRFHVPLQILGFLITACGYYLGHSHGGRKFQPSAHEKMASILFFPILCQFSLGVYLKLHINEGTAFRRYVVKMHGILGISYPIWGWIQMLFGAITLGGYCRDGNLGQCLAHYIMGSSFIMYGIVAAIVLKAGTHWLQNSGQSMEYWESWVIMLWGAVNTFTEHRGTHWSHKDLQHTSLGILWWSGGALGIWNSRHRQRSIIPAFLIILTGWAMSAHTQATATSTKVHTAFGSTLAFAGAARVVEIIAINTSKLQAIGEVVPLQHLPPLLLIAAGLTFMSATDEELRYIDTVGMDHVTYILLIFSAAFMIYMFMSLLIQLYLRGGKNATRIKEYQGPEYERLEDREGNSIALDVYGLSPEEEDIQIMK